MAVILLLLRNPDYDTFRAVVSQHACMNSSVQSDRQSTGRSDSPPSLTNKREWIMGGCHRPLSLQLVLRLVTKTQRMCASFFALKEITKSRRKEVNANDGGEES